MRMQFELSHRELEFVLRLDVGKIFERGEKSDGLLVFFGFDETRALGGQLITSVIRIRLLKRMQKSRLNPLVGGQCVLQSFPKQLQSILPPLALEGRQQLSDAPGFARVVAG